MKSLSLILLFSNILAGIESEKKLIDSFLAVDAHGKGNKEAVSSLDLIDQLNPSSIPRLLNAMNHANAVGNNWIRAAISEILQSSTNFSFPEKDIKRFILDSKNQGSSRRTAFEILSDFRPKQASALIPTFLNDPETTLRREAISQILSRAENEGDEKKAINLLHKALNNARDVDQIQSASKALKEKGHEIDLLDLMGFISQWEMLGPFDNSEREGFAKPYLPETEKVKVASYEGKNGEINWSALVTKDSLGKVDINKEFGELKEVLAYACTEFYSDRKQKVQFRLGSKNAWKIWVNGKFLFGRDEYHRGGTRVDQFIIDGFLNQGKNQILLKVCQNEQTQPWTKQWEFCLRITDPTGKVIPNNLKNK